MKEHYIKLLTPIVAIITIGALLTFALIRNVDGVALAGGIGIIAGLGGFTANALRPSQRQ